MQLSDRSLRFRDDILELPGVSTWRMGSQLPSLKLTVSPLKMDGWNTIAFPIGFRPVFSGYVSFRECKWLGSPPICFSHL